MASDQADHGVAEVGEGFDAVEFGRLDERSEDRPVLGTAVGTGEESRFARHGDGADGPFDGVVVHFDPAVVEEDAEALPTGNAVANGLGQGALSRESGDLGFEPSLEVVDQRTRADGSHRLSVRRRRAADFVLDGIEGGDPAQGFGGQWGAIGLVDFVQAATPMRPTVSEDHAVIFAGADQIVEGNVGIDLQDAVEGGQVGHRMFGLAVFRVDIGDSGRGLPLPWSIIPRIGPQPTGLGFAPTWIEHRHRRVVGEDPGRAEKCSNR